MRSARCSTSSASRPSSNTANRRASSVSFPGWRRPNSLGSAGCTATPSSIRRACSTRSLRLKAAPRLRFAGQITGCEGYVESAAIGLIAGRLAAAERLGEALSPPPPTTAIGALLNHITGGHIEAIDAGPRSFQPMNVNFGLFPPIDETRVDENGKRLRGPERGFARKRALSARAAADLAEWIEASA